MPIKANCFSYFSKRFDFGVPLEDIFPPNDIHPRLKYLFEEAFKLHAASQFNIEQLIRLMQGPLQTRLKLKHKIITDVHYDINTEVFEKFPGTYFWLIRHFLGLLPIPLLPTYSQEIYFDWGSLSEDCKIFLRHYESERKKNEKLDYEIAENLNLLPFEHFLLLTVLIYFIRNLSRKNSYGSQIDRKSLLFLSKYYSSSCVRPYIPGHKDEKMFPLFFYLVLRWREIEKKCKAIGHPAYFLESNYFSYETYPGLSIRDNWSQTTQFSLDIITVHKNIPYFSNNNNYLKDTGCQTDQKNGTEKGVQNPENPEELNENTTKNQEVLNQENSSIYPALSGVSPLMDESLIENDKMYDDLEFSFVSTNTNNKEEWNDVVNETVGTVKKVEEYMYDDYDTFNKEEYNQLSDKNNSKGSLFHKVTRIGWTYTPPNNSARGNTIHDNSNELDETYIKFEDVFDENGRYKVNEVCENSNESENRENSLNVTFKKDCDSKTPLYDKAATKSAYKTNETAGKNSKSYNFKRFKLKLDFLRVLTPKRVGSMPSYDSIESKIKYRKIKNIKSSTL